MIYIYRPLSSSCQLLDLTLDFANHQLTKSPGRLPQLLSPRGAVNSRRSGV